MPVPMIASEAMEYQGPDGVPLGFRDVLSEGIIEILGLPKEQD